MKRQAPKWNSIVTPKGNVHHFKISKRGALFFESHNTKEIASETYLISLGYKPECSCHLLALAVVNQDPNYLRDMIYTSQGESTLGRIAFSGLHCYSILI